ncbi:MAG: hypothetical protein CM1200mP35_02390 [Chloroflexota bacterium]|nr:MAG: hypothetical protein CM1200mP35_02390 [Chloroflexota bacterium]
MSGSRALFSAGQEAVATGVCSQLSNEDYMGSTQKRARPLLCKRCRSKVNDGRAFWESYRGPNKGKGGSMHIADMSKGMLGKPKELWGPVYP